MKGSQEECIGSVDIIELKGRSEFDNLMVFFFQAEDGIRDRVRSRGARRCV